MRLFNLSLFKLISVFCFLLITALPSHAEFVDDQRALLTTLKTKFETSTHTLEDTSLDDAQLSLIRSTLDQLTQEALSIAVSFRPKREALNKRLAELGPEPNKTMPPEAPVVAVERARLVREKSDLNSLTGIAEDLTLDINKTLDQITQRRRALFSYDLYKRVDLFTVLNAEVGKTVEQSVTKLYKSLLSWGKFVVHFKVNAMLSALFFALFIALVMFGLSRRVLSGLYQRDPDSEHPSYISRLSVAFWSTLIPSVSFFIFITCTYYLFDYFKVLKSDISQILAGLLQILALIYFVFRLAKAILSPDLPAWQLLKVDPKPARLLTYLITATAVITGVDRFTNIVSEVQKAPLLLTIAQSFFASLCVGFSVITMSLVKPSQTPKNPRLHKVIRIGFFILGLIPIIAALLGYVGLSRFMTQQIVVSGALVTMMVLGFKSAQSLSKENVFIKSQTGDFLRKHYALTDSFLDRMGVLLSILINILVCCIGIPLILLQWRFQWEDIKSFIIKVLNGFTIGSMTISPIGVLSGILAFLSIFLLTRWFQSWLDTNILSRGRIDTGVRHSIRTAFGYTGIGIALLIGISFAGINLSSLALVAGALSLGIGFGLQNIVSNFVSGLILLAERPFKVGDWIVAGATSGYVRKISVRATEIETFQNQTVILPNSELINAAVGNWTHRNKSGRVEIIISVASTSNPHQVRDILLQAVKSHPLVLKNPEPFVLLQGFSDVSIHFEVRIHLLDITKSPFVQNDIRFMVYDEFKKHAIEMAAAPKESSATSTPLNDSSKKGKK